MSKKLAIGIAMMVFIALVASACAPAATPAPTAAQPAANAQPTAATNGGSGGQKSTTQANPASGTPLKISGLVETELSLAEDKVKAMKTLSVESKNNKGETASYTGVLISDLLNQAKPKAKAANVVLVGDDGATAKVPLADLLKCANCILSFRSNGGFSAVLPGFASNMQVKGVVDIQVKE